MAHQIPKLILEHADSVANKKAAVEKALALGMPLNEIEEYLDWLDARDTTLQPEKLSKSELGSASVKESDWLGNSNEFRYRK